MRLDRFLANNGLGTRTEVKKGIRSGLAEVNGQVVKSGDLQIDPQNDIVTYVGLPVFYEEFHYYMLNKPSGFITATSGYDTVMELLAEPFNDLFPVGRLDKDTEGLLLITDNGILAHQLLSPKYGIEKEYLVHSSKDLSEEDIRKISLGVSEGGDLFRPAKVMKIADCIYDIVVTEGKFHEVKRIFLAVGNEVVSLRRVRFATLVLDDDLPVGEYRVLKKEEIAELQAAVA